MAKCPCSAPSHRNYNRDQTVTLLRLSDRIKGIVGSCGTMNWSMIPFRPFGLQFGEAQACLCAMYFPLAEDSVQNAGRVPIGLRAGVAPHLMHISGMLRPRWMTALRTIAFFDRVSLAMMVQVAVDEELELDVEDTGLRLWVGPTDGVCAGAFLGMLRGMRTPLFHDELVGRLRLMN